MSWFEEEEVDDDEEVSFALIERRNVRVLIDLTLISLKMYRERARSSGQLT